MYSCSFHHLNYIKKPLRIGIKEKKKLREKDESYYEKVGFNRIRCCRCLQWIEQVVVLASVDAIARQFEIIRLKHSYC